MTACCSPAVLALLLAGSVRSAVRPQLLGDIWLSDYPKKHLCSHVEWAACLLCRSCRHPILASSTLNSLKTHLAVELGLCTLQAGQDGTCCLLRVQLRLSISIACSLWGSMLVSLPRSGPALSHTLHVPAAHPCTCHAVQLALVAGV